MSRATIEKLAAVGLEVRPVRVGKATVLAVELRPGHREMRVELDDAATHGVTR